MILDPVNRGGTKPCDLPKIAGALQQASLPAGALASAPIPGKKQQRHLETCICVHL